ncbi:hypothetical protein [Halostagnicola sp. A56]|uniref:hypothetical protein n=1 Tax=Halostagnicola sp. A56 TaxID=1495067 RepID=UPI0012E29CB0|nr:hypothetical protein [Halostagnicola sp. A56]
MIWRRNNGVSIGDIEINEVVLVITVPDENKPREILDGWISEQDDLTAIPDVEGHLDEQFKGWEDYSGEKYYTVVLL